MENAIKLDLVEKVEQLAQITTSLKNEINELKGKDLNVKVDELEHETAELKNDINDLRYSLMQQNQKILSLLNEQNEKLEETIDAEKLAPQILFNKKFSEIARRFPISSLDGLDAIEELITDENLHELISTVQQLLTPHGIVKNINNVIATDVIMECNVDGHHNKRRLLNHPKFMDLLFQAAFTDGYSQKAFLDDIRRGLKMVKNRHNKNLCRNRQSQRQVMEHEQSEDTMPPTELLKTEEIFFDN